MTQNPRRSDDIATHKGAPHNDVLHPAGANADGHGSDAAEQLAEVWARIRGRLQKEVGDLEYRNWLRNMTLVGLDGDEVTIHLPSTFLRDYVRTHFSDRLNHLWQSENCGVRRVDIRVGSMVTMPRNEALPRAPEPVRPLAPLASSSPGQSLLTRPAEPVREIESARDLRETALDPRFAFDHFVVGKPNEFAYACARRVAEQPSSRGFNPLFLYGGVGLGKTHLMHAIGLELARREGANISVKYMSAEIFMHRFIAAIRSQSTMEFKGELRGVDVLMIDDLQFLIGKDNTQEEFFHTFNALVDAGKQIVVSADKSPSDLSGIEDRLRTRLGWGMVADLHATTYELRLSILEAKASVTNRLVPPKVLEFLAHRITGNIRELEGSLNRLIAHADLVGRPITLESAQEVLHDLLKAHDRRVTIEDIQKKVAEHWSIRLTDMTSARRARAVARPRQVAMYLAKHLTSRSLPEIGRKFGNRDHTTVMHAVSRVTELMEADPEFRERVELLRHMLEN